MGKGSTSYGTTTSNSSSGPWAPQQAPIQYGLGEAQNIYQNTQPSTGLTQQAGNYLSGTMSGQGPQNAYMDDVYTAMSNKITPMVQSQFGTAGRAGNSPVAQGTIAEGIANATAPYMFGAAENQMNRQMQAANAAPGLESIINSQPWQQLGQYMNVVGQPYGSQSSSTGQSPVGHSSGFQVLGK